MSDPVPVQAPVSVEVLLESDWANDLKSAVEHLLTWVDPEIADLLVKLEKAQRILVYRALPRQRAADVFSYLEPSDQDTLQRLYLMQIRSHCLLI